MTFMGQSEHDFLVIPELWAWYSSLVFAKNFKII
jgi:hypothetical protein